MARTTSAGQGETFARAVWATTRLSLRAMPAIGSPRAIKRLVGLGALAAAHVATLSIVSPRIEGDHELVALALLASLVVSAIILLVGLGETAAAEVGNPGPQPAILAFTAETEPAHANEPPVLNPLSRSTHNELMARVSHELRTPLNAVVGFSDLMGHELFGPLGHPRYEEYVGYIRESGRKLLKSAEDTIAITSLLTASEGTCRPKEFTLASVAREARQIVGFDAPDHAERLNFEIDPEIAVMAHRRVLKQVLVNLLSEAIARAAEASEIVLAADTTDDKVLLRVSVPRTGGLGLETHASLPICLARTLVELSGGRLVEICDQHGSWQVSTLLDRAAQPDFFLPLRNDVPRFAHANR